MKDRNEVYDPVIQSNERMEITNKVLKEVYEKAEEDKTYRISTVEEAERYILAIGNKVGELQNSEDEEDRKKAREIKTLFKVIVKDIEDENSIGDRNNEQ